MTASGAMVVSKRSLLGTLIFGFVLFAAGFIATAFTGSMQTPNGALFTGAGVVLALGLIMVFEDEARRKAKKKGEVKP